MALRTLISPQQFAALLIFANIQRTQNNNRMIPLIRAYSMMRRLARFWRNTLYGVRKFEIPVHIRQNFRNISSDNKLKLIDGLKKSHFSNRQYYNQNPDTYLMTEHGKIDLDNHIEGRLNRCRSVTIPWIDSLISLNGAKILEIGCGTGTSTVALAEQGAQVTAFDVDELSLECAQIRLSSYNLNADLVRGNASDLWNILSGSDYDAIICVALLEHMTLEERLSFLKQAWNFIRPGALLVIDDTPNRLWFHDPHTSYENFYFWLPDDLAMKWAPLTERPVFNTLFKDGSDPTLFARWGRGVSYHDFCLAFSMKPSDLPVKSFKQAYYRDQTRTHQIAATPYEKLLRRIEPSISPSFFLPDIEIAFVKP